ncbi:MAG: hypothetical protein R2774_15470 [Saprospiraceae bacterium]
MMSDETFKLLFEKHSSQVEEKRKKIHTTTEKVVGVLLVINGWLISQDVALDTMEKYLFLLIVIVVAITSMYVIYRDNKIYRNHARIVRQMSEELGTFKEGAIVKGITLYPNEWRKFGNENVIHGVIHHYLVMICVAGLTAIVIFN